MCASHSLLTLFFECMEIPTIIPNAIVDIDQYHRYEYHDGVKYANKLACFYFTHKTRHQHN